MRECDIVCCVLRCGAGFLIWSATFSTSDSSALYRINAFLFYWICLISRRNPTWKRKKIGEKFKHVGVSGKREKFVCGKRNKKGKESFHNYLQPYTFAAQRPFPRLLCCYLEQHIGMRDNNAVICLMAAGKTRAKRKALFVAGYRSGRKDSPLLYLRRSFHKNTKAETPCNIGSCTSFSVAQHFVEHITFHTRSIILTL